MEYFRPILHQSGPRPKAAAQLGWCWFDRVEVLSRSRKPQIISVHETPAAVLANITGKRADIAGLALDRPKVMGILNVTPDSFSDGGLFNAPDAAIAQAQAMVAAGADIIDIGGESTRPGAKTVDNADEISRTAPVIAAIRKASDVAMSIDTRKSDVATAALDAGATLVNDVAAMSFDAGMAKSVADNNAPICLMHAQGDPATMQQDPQYDDVLLDVYDFLAARIEIAVNAGIDRLQIMVDPGIGFGKTQAHNLTLLRGLSLFHGLGCPILLGASRKRFIGDIGHAPAAHDRVGGSVAVALGGIAQGAQMVRVHDVFETKQAIDLHFAVTSMGLTEHGT